MSTSTKGQRPTTKPADKQVYGRAVSRAEYRRDPAAVMREAARDGAVTIVDEHGVPQASICVPDSPDDRS